MTSRSDCLGVGNQRTLSNRLRTAENRLHTARYAADSVNMALEASSEPATAPVFSEVVTRA